MRTQRDAQLKSAPRAPRMFAKEIGLNADLVESDTYKTQGTYLSKTLTVPLGHWDAGWSAQSIILNRISLPLYISDSNHIL